MINKKLLFILALMPIFLKCSQSGDDNSKKTKPNILWITIEDTSPQFIGIYGNETANTPVIDKLAKEGVLFTNAFSTGTVCSPSRTAIITGVKVYKTGTGNHRSKYPVPDFIKGFPYYLRKQGYYTTNNVKTDYNVAGEKEFINEAWNESSREAGWWGRNPCQPFFSVFNYNDSHQSRTMTMSYDWYLENVYNKLKPEERIGDNEFDMPPFYKDTPDMRKQFARVYNSVKLTDNKIGQLLSRLEKDNLKDSTIIFFYADHGEGMPRGKTNGIGFGYRIPFIIWFPEMYKDLSPWGTGDITTDELIDFTDLGATLISIAGGNIPEHMDGRPFMGDKRSNPPEHLFLSNDRSDNGIDMVRTVTDGKYLYSRNFMPFIPEARYIRYMEIGEIKQLMRNDLQENNLNPLQKSLFESRPPEFLFDIENDIWETNNLAENPDFKQILLKMRSLMKNEIISSRDIMLLPEYETEVLSKSTTAYQFRLDDTKYPLERIYEAACLSGFRGKEVTKKQIEFLNDHDEIIRYWAIIGLRSQKQSDLKPYSTKIIDAIGDPYPPVAVTASAIAFELFNNRSAGEKLKQFCAGKNLNISLMAINYLLYTTNKEPFVKTIKEVHSMGDRNYNVKAACMNFLGSMGLVPNNFNYRE